VSGRPGFVSDHNAVIDRFSIDGGDTVISLAAWQALGYDAPSFVTTPAALFVAPGSDFHLLTTAPAIDAGSATGAPSADLDGNPRPVGAAVDVGAYEAQLLTCGDGTVDPGEQCGEPGLSCADPCTTCAGCVCAVLPPVCGDALVCGAEECEQDGDCGGGQVCQGCQCTNPPVCASGIGVAKPSLTMKASPFSLKWKGEAVIPKPWTGIDPSLNGVRVVIDAVADAGGIDVTLPGGPAWTTNATGNRWTYRDAHGTVGGITRVSLQDRSKSTDGLLRFVVQGKGGTAVLPDVSQVRSALVVGAPGECASLTWNPPAGARPRCTGATTRLKCR
jgi:hypothetical protein